MRIIPAFCRHGHKMAGNNILWHTRYDESGQQTMVRECRTCANERYRAKRQAAKRNQQLAQEVDRALAG